MEKKPVYRVAFVNNGKTYEVYAKRVAQGDLYGFIEIEGLLFNSRSGLVVDPSEEKLKSEFDGVKITQVPVHSIIRIDQVEKMGNPKIGEASSNVISPFPVQRPGIGDSQK